MTDPLSIGHFRRENCRAMLDYFTQRRNACDPMSPKYAFYAREVKRYADWMRQIDRADAVGAEPPPLVLRNREAESVI